MKNNTFEQKKQVFIVILSSIMLFLALTLSVSYAWIIGTFTSGGETGTNNPITYIDIEGTQGAVTGTLTLGQTSISKSISFKNNSAVAVKVEEVFVTISFYENQEKYDDGISYGAILNDYDENKYHITPTLANGWTTTDNISYSTTSNIINSNVNLSFITGFTLSDISADYNFDEATIYEIIITITTSQVA